MPRPSSCRPGTADIGLYVRAYPANVIAQYKQTDPDHLHKSASGSAIFISWNNPAEPEDAGPGGVQAI